MATWPERPGRHPLWRKREGRPGTSKAYPFRPSDPRAASAVCTNAKSVYMKPVPWSKRRSAYRGRSDFALAYIPSESVSFQLRGYARKLVMSVAREQNEGPLAADSCQAAFPAIEAIVPPSCTFLSQPVQWSLVADIQKTRKMLRKPREQGVNPWTIQPLPGPGKQWKRRNAAE